jgi:hypothetical protein
MRIMAACWAADAGAASGRNWVAEGIFGKGELGAAVWAAAVQLQSDTAATSATQSIRLMLLTSCRPVLQQMERHRSTVSGAVRSFDHVVVRLAEWQ